MFLTNVVLSVFILYCSAAAAQEPILLGEIRLPQAGFSNIYVHENPADPTEAFSLIVSTFLVIPGVKDDVVMFLYPGKYLDDPSSADIRTLGTEYEWPREPSQIDADVFGSSQLISQPCGFLVPGKDNGSITIIDFRDPENIINTDLTFGSEGDVNAEELWFYHRAIWLDADGDGLKDMFTCRARQVGQDFNSEFNWYRNPGGDSPATAGPWDFGLNFTKDLCDVFLVPVELTVNDVTYTAIFTSGYFSRKLGVYWTEDADGLWNDPNTLHDRVILTVTDDAECDAGEDAVCGHVFDIWVEDIDLDGRLDMLVSINSEVYGSLYVLEIPDDFRSGDFVSHKIVEGFFPRSGMQGGGSPGQVKTFLPSSSTTRPWILMSGDDDGRTYFLEPLDETPGTWNYNMTVLNDQGPRNIVGTPTAFDSDGDGTTEVFVPCYSVNLVKFFTFV